MDDNINKVPMPRWQMKLNGSSANLNAGDSNTSKISIPYNSAISTSLAAASAATVNFKGTSPGILYSLCNSRHMFAKYRM